MLAVPPAARGDLVAETVLPITTHAELRVLTVPGDGLIVIEPVPGWDVRAQDAAGAVPVVDGRIIARQGPVSVVWTRPVLLPPPGAQVVEGRVRLEPAADGDGVAISLDATVRGSGGALGPVRILIPATVAVAAITGDGVTGWRRDGDTVMVQVVMGRDRIQLAIRAFAPGPGAVLPRFAGTTRLRVAVAPWPGRVPALGGGERAPAEGDEQAAVLVRDGSAVELRLGEPATPAAPAELVAVVDGPDRLRVALALPGLPAWSAQRVAVPPGWTLIDGSLDQEPDGVWLRGGGRWLRFDAPAGTATVPVLVPGARGPRRVLVVGAGDRDPQTVPGWLADDAAALRTALAAAGVDLPAGRDRAVRGDGALPLVLAGRDGEATVADSHFAVVETDMVRWSTHLACEPGPAGLERVVVDLPEGLRLVRIGLPPGAHSATAADGTLVVDLPGRVRGAFALDLDAEAPIAAGTVRIRPPRLRGLRWTGGTVALAEADTGTSLLHRSGSGLEDGGAPRLPDGVAPEAVQHRLRAVRADWSLDLHREALDLGGGPDGVATQVDAVSWWLPDGELRSRVRWRVLNRSRSVLALRMPPGARLWEVRVGDRPVTPRQDGGRLWIPVPRMRAGEAAVRIDIESIDRAPGPGLALPVIEDLRIMQVLWRIAGRDGLAWQDGPFTAIDPVQAEADRAERASADLERLRAQRALGPAARARLDRELARLDLELADAQAAIGGRSVAGDDWSSLISSKRQAVKKLQRDNDEGQNGYLIQSRGLNYDQNGNRGWAKGGTGPRTASADQAPPPPEPMAMGLGDGDPAPGLARRGDGPLTGADLLADLPSDGLVLRGTGASLEVVVTQPRTDPRRWPWILVLAAIALAGAAWRWRRD
jgi:hypothetical protein